MLLTVFATITSKLEIIVNYKLTVNMRICRPRNSSAYSIQYGLIEITREPVNSRNVSKIYCREFDSEKLINDCAVLEVRVIIG